MRCNYLKVGYTTFLILSLFVGLTAGSIAVADGHGDKTISPVRFNAEQIDGKNLAPAGYLQAKTRGTPRQVIKQTNKEPRAARFFAGDIVALVYESGPAKLRLENTLYDEFIQIKEGVLILTTEATGKSEKFVEGDTLIVPKGFTGTWEMVGKTYRELVVVETKTLTDDATAE